MTTIDQTSDPMKGRRTPAWMISVIFAATLAYASSASALRPIKDPGDDPSPEPDPTCIPAATGHISASPATVELRPGASPNSTLSWSASVTKDCSSIISFEINGLRVVSHGKATKSFDKPGTYRYTLTIRTPNGSRQTLATTVVEVKTLFPVTLSEGKKVRPWDIQQFDDRWMYPPLLDLSGWEGALKKHSLPVAWELSERMRAMVRMYEITHERRYLDHLRDITEMVLQYRDDRHPTELHLDEFLPRLRTPMPAWGTSSPGNAWHWRTSPVIAALYSYPIAALARIVVEDPNLQAEYGESALRYTKAVMETFEAYYPDWFARQAGDSRQRFMTSPETRTLLTQEKCDRAYQEALDMKPEPWDAPDRLKTFHQQCKDGATYKPGPEPFNVSHEFMMMAIELFRAIDSNFYQRSSTDQWVADADRRLILALVTGHQRFFADALGTTHFLSASQDPPVNPNLPLPTHLGPPRFVWNYMVDSFRPHIEDPSHGALSMSYIGLLRDNQSRLDAKSAPPNAIPLTSEDLDKFANTFLYNVAPGPHFRHDVSGRIKDRPADRYDDRCEGWLQLARANPRVYSRCEAITLCVVDDFQPKLNIGNHSELLWTKRFR
ncbi:MAG: hypothetical protein LUQ11_10370 [Methylococcaceae bacterium]|nr:hypothetical protein [Methylococcaceae bacterium]